MTSNYFTPLRYPGGKGKLAEYIKVVMAANKLIGGCYVEPYAGGAAVALELLLIGYVDEVHINDLNDGIYAFWDCVLNDTDAFIEKIQGTPVTIEEWFFQKSIQSSENPESLDLAFATFFLNRCNRSGILKAGVIGGKKQDGKWKLDARFNKDDLIGRMRKIKNFRDRIFLYNRDAVDLVKDLSVRLPRNTLFYLDPPYYVKGEGLYDNFYNHEDHLEVAEAIKNVDGVHWIVSYDDVPQIREMYSDCRALRYKLSYSAQRREQGGEIMFFDPKMVIPEVPQGVPMHMAA